MRPMSAVSRGSATADREALVCSCDSVLGRNVQVSLLETTLNWVLKDAQEFARKRMSDPGRGTIRGGADEEPRHGAHQSGPWRR